MAREDVANGKKMKLALKATPYHSSKLVLAVQG